MTALLKRLNQKPIAYYPVYRELVGSTTGGILLSQLMYWLSKKDKIHKTDEDIRGETLLSKKELENAKKLIKKLDFITVSREGIPAKTYYQIDWDKWVTCLTQKGSTDTPKGGNCYTPNGETNIVKSKETTTETTTETKKNNIKKEEYQTLKLYQDLTDVEKSIYDEYIDLRKLMKLKTAQRSHTRLLNKYYEYGRNPAVIENAINANWKDFYPIKQGYTSHKEPEVGSIAWRMQQEQKKNDNTVDAEVIE